MRSIRLRSLLAGFLLAIFVAACTGASPTPTIPPVAPSTPTPVPSPSPTPLPMALIVNAEGIPVVEFEAELARLKDAQTAHNISASADQQKQTVLDDLTNQMLLAQAARQAGFTLDEGALDSRIQIVKDKAGGEGSFSDWLNKNHYTPDSFRSALRRSIAATWQVEDLASKVPTTAEQIHARQILVLNQKTADSFYKLLQSGTVFATLASELDPLTKGDLGWFPRGYLTQVDVENAAFALQPGGYSVVIQTSFGFHIVQLLDRKPDAILAPDVLRQLQRQALSQWLKQQHNQAKVEIRI